MLGVHHILGGVDHLLFVLGLLLIVRGGNASSYGDRVHRCAQHHAGCGDARVGARAWTAGRSAIALSIVFVAAEVVHGWRGRPGLTARAPWVVAFTFGLLHGFGFAGALAEVGLPQHAIPIALLMFNVGVEVGQLMFIGVVLAIGAFVKPYIARWPAAVHYVAPYAIGTVAMFWVIDRVGAF